jgi:preprotein translocase subunit SecD
VTSAGPATACNKAGTTTYKLAKTLGAITPTSVALTKNQGPANAVTLGFSKADASTLGDVSRKAIDKHLAIILEGRVISAPLVKQPLTARTLTLAFRTASGAKQVAAKLGAYGTP